MKTILLVEDEEPLRHALSKKLKHEGYALAEATNGKTGLDLAITLHPELILLDIVMPVMDGITMLKLLRDDSWGKTAKVLLLTNLNDSEKVDESVRAQAYDYLVKSNWKLEDLVKLIKERIGE